MANLTIAIDDEILKQARIRAIEQGTSVNAVLRDYLAGYAGANARQEKALRSLVRLSQRSKARRGTSRWTRDDLHER
jgi:plasmid stability protein